MGSALTYTLFIVISLAAAEKGAVPGSVMKNTGEMVRSRCLPTLAKEEFKTKDYEVKTPQGKLALDEEYRRAVLQTMARVVAISGDPSLFKAPIRVEQHRGGRHGGNCFNFTPGGRVIQLVSGCTKTLGSPYEYAVKHFVHELGHLIGQEHGNYAAYMAKVPKPCHISSYGMNNTNKAKRNEEFADVFRAVVFDLERVRSAGGSCVAAADFFKDLLKLKPQECK
jgi:hypothetical protein